MKLEYKPVAIQNEGWGDINEKEGITVLVKLEAVSKKTGKKWYKNIAETFHSPREIELYMEKHDAKLLAEDDFKATKLENVLALMQQI